MDVTVSASMLGGAGLLKKGRPLAVADSLGVTTRDSMSPFSVLDIVKSGALLLWVSTFLAKSFAV